jgi:hypothetical protein
MAVADLYVNEGKKWLGTESEAHIACMEIRPRPAA